MSHFLFLQCPEKQRTEICLSEPKSKRSFHLVLFRYDLVFNFKLLELPGTHPLCPWANLQDHFFMRLDVEKRTQGLRRQLVLSPHQGDLLPFTCHLVVLNDVIRRKIPWSVSPVFFFSYLRLFMLHRCGPGLRRGALVSPLPFVPCLDLNPSTCSPLALMAMHQTQKRTLRSTEWQMASGLAHCVCVTAALRFLSDKLSQWYL